MIVELVSYPRSGMQFLRMVCWYCFGIKTTSVYNEGGDFNYNALSSYNPPRGIHFRKNHRQPSEVDDNPVVYLVRDGRASIVSYVKMMNGREYDAELAKRVIDGEDDQYGRVGAWGCHVANWLQDRRTCHIIRFQDLVTDPVGVVSSMLGQFDIDHTRYDDPPGIEELVRDKPGSFTTGNPIGWRDYLDESDEHAFLRQHQHGLNAFLGLSQSGKVLHLHQDNDH